MPARKKASKDHTVHQPTLFEKIGGQAIHISHEIAAGTGHLLEAAGEKFDAVKESIINKIGKRVPVKKTAVKKKTAKKIVKKAAVKVKKAVAVKKKVVKKAVKKVVKKKAVKKAKSIGRRR